MIRIVFVPSASVGTVIDDVNVSTFFSLLLDVTQSTQTTFTIPFMGVFPWLRCPRMNTAPVETDESFGEMRIYLVNGIQSFASVSQTIYAQLWISAAEDFAFAGIRTPSLYPEVGIPTLKAQGEEVHGDIRQVFRKPFPSFKPFTVSVPKNMCVSNIWTRWTEYYSRFHFFASFNNTDDVEYQLSIGDIMSANTHGLQWYFSAFLKHSGGLRVLIVPTRKCSNVRIFARARYGWEVIPSAPVNISEGAIYREYQVGQVIDVMLPQMNRSLWMTPNWMGIFTTPLYLGIYTVGDAPVVGDMEFNVFVALAHDARPEIPMPLPLNFPNALGSKDDKPLAIAAQLERKLHMK
jgi:hypothetical protein